MSDVQWTNKLPSLVVGALLAIIGIAIFLWSRARWAVISGLVLIALGAAFIGYSLTIKDWCYERHPESGFSAGFGGSFRGCIAKGWLSF